MAERDGATDRFSGFVAGLDPAGRATLRRSLAFPAGAWPPAFQYVERFVIDANPWQRRMAYLVAGLQASSRATEANGNFGAAADRLQRATGSGSIENRFMAVLDADESALAHHLRQMITLMSSQGVAPDWAQLRRDLTAWHHPDRIVQQRWARAFYRDRQTQDDTATETSNSTPEEETHS